MLLKKSTAVTIKFGPFVDSTDGNTDKAALTLQKADIKLSKNGAAMASASSDQGASDAGAAYDALGCYNISLDTTDTNTEGRLRVVCHKTGALPVWMDFDVLPAKVFDSLVGGTDNLEVDAIQLLGTAFAAPGTAGIPKVQVSAIDANQITAASMHTDASDEIVTKLFAKSVDASGLTDVTVARLLKVLLSYLAGKIAVDNTDPTTSDNVYYAQDDTTPLLETAPVKVDGSRDFAGTHDPIISP